MGPYGTGLVRKILVTPSPLELVQVSDTCSDVEQISYIFLASLTRPFITLLTGIVPMLLT
jgi:hypothetical protein